MARASSGVTAPGRLLRTAAIVAVALGALAALGCAKAAPPAGASFKVAAAADLTFAFGEAGEAFTKKSGVKPVFTFGSTGLLAKQLDQGAPFDVFAAANAGFADEVVGKGACDGETRTLYARGRLVVWTRKASGAAPPASLAELADPRYRRIAIANPEHAPYGRAAEQALEHTGILRTVKPRLVYGENVQQALQFARTGNADAAIVALSLAIASTDGTFVPVEQSAHAALDQVMVACLHGRGLATGRQFMDFIGSPEGHAIMKRHGFLLPGEPLAQAP